METMKTTALHPPETKSITCGLTCTGSAKNADEISTMKEEQLLSGTGKDHNEVDAISEDSLRLRVSADDQAEQDGASGNRDLANFDRKERKATDQVSEVLVKPPASTESSKDKEVEKIEAIEKIEKSFGEEKIGVVNSVKLTQEAQQSGNFYADDKKMSDRHLYNADKKRTSADNMNYKGPPCINNSYSQAKRTPQGNRWSYPNEMHNRSFYNGRIESVRNRYRLKNKALLSNNSPYNNRYYNVLPHTRARGETRRNPYYNGKYYPVGRYKNVERTVKTDTPVTESQDKVNNETECNKLSKSLPADTKSAEENEFIIIDEVTDDDSAGTGEPIAGQTKNCDDKNGDLTKIKKKLKDCPNAGGTSEKEAKENTNVDDALLDVKQVKPDAVENAKKAVKINETVDNNCPVNNEDDEGDASVNSVTENSKDVSDSQNDEIDKLVSNDTAVENNCDRESTQSVNVDGQIVNNEIKVSSEICTKVNDDASAQVADTLNIENANGANGEKIDETTQNIQTISRAVLSSEADHKENEKQTNIVEETEKNLDENSKASVETEDDNVKTEELCVNKDIKNEVSECKADDNEKVIPAVTNGVDDVEVKKEPIDNKSDGASSSDSSIKGVTEEPDASSTDKEAIDEKSKNAIAIENAEKNQDHVVSKEVESSDKNNVKEQDDIVASENCVLSDIDKNSVKTGSTKSTDSPSENLQDGLSIKNDGKSFATKRRRRKRPKRKLKKRKVTEPEYKPITKEKTTNSVKKNDKQVNTRKDKKSIDTENITVDLTGEELSETVSKNSNDTATDISEKVTTAIGRTSRKRTLQMLSAVQENDVQETHKGRENSRQKRRTAKNAEETVKKELLSNSHIELNNGMDKKVSLKNKATDDTKTVSVAACQSSLKRLLQENNEVGTDITVKKPRINDEIRKSNDKDQRAQENEDSIKSLNYVRKFFQRDTKEKLSKLTQAELEELLIQKIVETIAMRGEIGKLREQAKISERNQEATRVRCLHLSRQLKDLELVLNHSISERRSNNEKIVAPIKINRSVGLQVNFVADGTMHNLRQLQQVMPAKSPFLPNGTVIPIPDSPEATVATNSVPRRGLKIRSPRRIDAPSSAPVTPVPSQTQTTQAAVSSVVTPTALIIGKSSESAHNINNFSEVATTGSALPKVNNSPHTAAPQGVMLNGKLPSPVNRQVASGNFKKTVTNNDLIDLTDEEEKSKSDAIGQNTLKTAVSEPEVTIASKSQTRYQKVLPTHQVLPGNVALATQQTNVRLITPQANNPTPTALMNNMQNPAPTVTYFVHGTGATRQIVLAPNPPQSRQPAPSTRGPVSSVTYKGGVAHLENGMRLLAPPPIANIQLLKHPAPLPDVRNNSSNPSWKLPPPAPSLKITKVLNGIVLSWNMNLNDTYAKIVSYQLYAYQELPNVVPSSNLWKKVGDVRALQLPMACTLTQVLSVTRKIVQLVSQRGWKRRATRLEVSRQSGSASVPANSESGGDAPLNCCEIYYERTVQAASISSPISEDDAEYSDVNKAKKTISLGGFGRHEKNDENAYEDIVEKVVQALPRGGPVAALTNSRHRRAKTDARPSRSWYGGCLGYPSYKEVEGVGRRRHPTRSCYEDLSGKQLRTASTETRGERRKLLSLSCYAKLADKSSNDLPRVFGSGPATHSSSLEGFVDLEANGITEATSSRIGTVERGMPSLRSFVVRRPMDMGSATSSVTSIHPPAKNGTSQKKADKSNKLAGIRLPRLHKESSAVNLSPMERSLPRKGANAPLLRPESSASLEARAGGSLINLSPGSLRKCETAVGLSTLAFEGRPINRSRVCSRCSSLLSLASSSRYSLAAGSFVPAASQQTVGRFLCKLCLSDVSLSNASRIEACGCSYCKDCMQTYVEFEIEEGAYEISCPDAQCEQAGVLSLTEISTLVTPELMEKHRKFRLNRDISMDKGRAWCPRAGCETICSVNSGGSDGTSPGPVHCPGCSTDFCSLCRESWHSGPCPDLPPGIPFDSDHIKCCPMCSVPIEKDEGCAQMMCKRCKHVFCWYCLASLDDDFLLRHYDKGPCKNKLGHSRASVIWHRTQVIGIFAGFGLLLLVASPLLLLAAPCIVCCKCRVCGSSRLEQEEGGPPEDATT